MWDINKNDLVIDIVMNNWIHFLSVLPYAGSVNWATLIVDNFLI